MPEKEVREWLDEAMYKFDMCGIDTEWPIKERIERLRAIMTALVIMFIYLCLQ